MDNKNNVDITREDALEAVRTLIKWIGEDPDRVGLVDTPKRFVDAYAEFFQGYKQDPKKELSKTFEDITGYSSPVTLREIPFESHCEHHIAPFLGKVWISYIPDKKVCGISKLARVVDIYAKRLQNQELMTKQIADAINNSLEPIGVAVGIDAIHECMSTRGIHKHGSSTITTHFYGSYTENENLRNQFMNLINVGIK